uniref:Uncharacterized protein n=1 Tax=Anopheles atroparvus TaxID=41427 RepID=A0AAG5DW56_ANOAO
PALCAVRTTTCRSVPGGASASDKARTFQSGHLLNLRSWPAGCGGGNRLSCSPAPIMVSTHLARPHSKVT